MRALLVMRLDADGDLVDALPTGPASDPEPLPDVEDVTAGAGPRTVGSDGGPDYRVVAIEAAGGGTVVVGESLADVQETVSQAERVLLVAGSLALVAAGLLVWLVIRRGLRPVASMIETAERIADGDFSERARVGDADDEVAHLGDALNTMVDRLTGAIDAKTESEAQMRRFVADASHELRTPLTSIRGYAELQRGGGGDIGGDEAIRRIEDEATRMAALVDDLLLLARLDQGRPLDRVPIDVATVVGEAVDAARVHTPSTTFDLDLPSEPAHVTGDPARLRQVVDNILTNAATHAGAGTTVTVSVTPPAAGDDGGVEIVIVDDGVGMTPDELHHALDRFWQAEPKQGGSPGTGLGLAIADEICRSHGGTLSLSSERGQGTTVEIFLPADA